MAEEDERRGGRKCETCHWFEPHNDDRRKRMVRGDGLCRWAPPPILHGATWGEQNRTTTYASSWCSLWTPNLAHPDL